MNSSLRIHFNNGIRTLLYKTYRLYKKHLEQKFHIYDLQTIDVIKTLPHDAVCIDIGANEGQIFNFIYKHCCRCNIVPIVSIPELLSYLKKKYHCKRVTFCEFALSDTAGECDFYYFPKRSTISGLHCGNIMQQMQNDIQTLKVKTARLDDIFNYERLDFIKIDVEGAEYKVLKGACKTLHKFKPLVVFESGIGGLEFFDNTPEDIFSLLQGISYHISTLEYYLAQKEALTKEEFVKGFSKGYNYQYIAYP